MQKNTIIEVKKKTIMELAEGSGSELSCRDLKSEQEAQAGEWEGEGEGEGEGCRACLIYQWA